MISSRGVCEQVRDLGVGECGGRLVEDQDLAATRQPRGDLDHLPLPDAERADGRRGVESAETQP